MKKSILSLFVLLVALPTSAQISYGGTPHGLASELKHIDAPPLVKMSAVDVNSLMAEDAAKLATGNKGPYRFGFNHAVDLGTDNAGAWYTYANGDRLWRVTVYCPGALAVGMEFHEYVIPNGAEVFVYNDFGDHLGSFTAESNGNRPTMGVQSIAGNSATIEYFEPASVAGQGALRISQITHAYRDPFSAAKGLGDSGSCNNNVICPEGDDWRDQIASVAMITVGGNGLCTGQLLNNCAEDGHPYFLTANHCIFGNVNNWIFRFNWDSPNCTPTTNGPTNQTVSGGTVLTQSAGSDVALLELNTAVPASYDVRWTGWDWSGTASTSNVAIHHPSGDIKKISFDDDAAIQTSWGSPSAQVWRIANWEDGTTEGGSSGSGLWDQNGRLIGQLYGGQASCSNNVNDYYGRFDVSWSLLSPYLGSCGPVLDMYPAAVLVDYDARISSINNIPADICGSDFVEPVVKVKNNGGITLTSFDVTYDVDNGPASTINWTGSLASGQEVDVTLPLLTPGNGAHTLNASVSNPNGMTDQNPTNDALSSGFTITDPGQYIDFLLTLDDYGSETTWELVDDMGNTLYTGGPYGDGLDGTLILERMCLNDGCYDLTIFDSVGDGICCGQWGDGDFDIADVFGTILVDGDGQFGSSVTETFCLSNTSINENASFLELSIVPNPTNGMVSIALPDAWFGEKTVAILDATGRVVLESSVVASSERITLDLSGLSNGMYSITIGDEAQQAMGRILLNR